MTNPLLCVGKEVEIEGKSHHVHGCSFLYNPIEDPGRTFLVECTRQGYKDKISLVIFSADGKNFKVARQEPESQGLPSGGNKKNGRSIYFVR